MTTVTIAGQQAPADRSHWVRLGGFLSVVGVLHGVGWGLFLYYARSAPALAGLGMLAYTFGLRHAFDADHIAAIDNTTRKLLAQGRRPMGVGCFFSLGHSTIVLAARGRTGGGDACGRLAHPGVLDVRRIHRRQRVGDVPVADRRAQPDRADRHRAHLLGDAQG